MNSIAAWSYDLEKNDVNCFPKPGQSLSGIPEWALKLITVLPPLIELPPESYTPTRLAPTYRTKDPITSTSPLFEYAEHTKAATGTLGSVLMAFNPEALTLFHLGITAGHVLANGNMADVWHGTQLSCRAYVHPEFIRDQTGTSMCWKRFKHPQLVNEILGLVGLSEKDVMCGRFWRLDCAGLSQMSRAKRDEDEVFFMMFAKSLGSKALLEEGGVDDNAGNRLSDWMMEILDQDSDDSDDETASSISSVSGRMSTPEPHLERSPPGSLIHPPAPESSADIAAILSWTPPAVLAAPTTSPRLDPLSVSDLLLLAHLPIRVYMVGGRRNLTTSILYHIMKDSESGIISGRVL